MNWSETLKSIFTLTLLCSTIRVSISILLAGMGNDHRTLGCFEYRC
jgi:hypothetical protein